jgi:hypothetical protein
LGSRTKNERKYKNNIYIKKIFGRNFKIIGARKGCWNAEKAEID